MLSDLTTPNNISNFNPRTFFANIKTSNMSENISKRPRVTKTTLEENVAELGNNFLVLMPSSTALKTAVEIMSHTLIDVTFKIERTSSTNRSDLCLRVDAVDSGSICACKVRIKCTGTVCDEQNDEFCIKLKPLLEILRALPGNEGVQLYQKKGVSDIELKTIGCESHHYKIHTLQDTYFNQALESCNTAFSVDFDLAKLKSHLRVVTNLKAETARIEIFKINSAAREEYNGKLILKLSCTGWLFFSSIETDGPGHVSFLAENIEEYTTLSMYDEEYSTEYLKNFTKSMERSSVTISFNDEEPKVLVMEYSLGQEESSIIFLLAPKISDTQ